MSATIRKSWLKLAAANAVALCMLGFYQHTDAQQRPSNLPFANSVEQRLEMVEQLKEIAALLKEQNALLRSGNVQVIAVPPQR